MRPLRLSIALFAAAWLGVVALPSLADNDKALQNTKGEVAYQAQHAAAKHLAPLATISLADKTYAITGDRSLATLTLPDSSTILIGSASKVQLAFFNQLPSANASFVLYGGRLRFAVRHPLGARANYVFKTAAASIAVRGTQGDIGVGNDGALRVNVYEVCDPTLPVEVTTKDGQHFTLDAGQSLVAHMVGNVVRAHIAQLSQQVIDQFSPDFGVPSSWDDAKGMVTGAATSAAESAASNATGGLASQLTSGLGGLFGKKHADTTPSPAPTQASCG